VICINILQAHTQLGYIRRGLKCLAVQHEGRTLFWRIAEYENQVTLLGLLEMKSSGPCTCTLSATMNEY